MSAPHFIDAPATLYVGDVMHARLKPVGHRFAYRVMSLLIDLDRLDAADRLSPLFGVDRAALFSFRQKDHGACDGSNLADHVRRVGREHGIDLTDGRIALLCYPRILGYVFNPLAVYFCWDRDGHLALMIYEVRNTYGGIHAYVLPVMTGQLTEAGVRQEQAKTFEVSPFIEMAMRYHFRVSPPAQDVKIRILETDAEGPLLSATFRGTARALSTRHLASAFAALPLMTLKIMAAIHWEALRLWLKGVRLASRQSSPTPHFSPGKGDAYMTKTRGSFGRR